MKIFSYASINDNAREHFLVYNAGYTFVLYLIFMAQVILFFAKYSMTVLKP